MSSTPPARAHTHTPPPHRSTAAPHPSPPPLHTASATGVTGFSEHAPLLPAKLLRFQARAQDLTRVSGVEREKVVYVERLRRSMCAHGTPLPRRRPAANNSAGERAAFHTLLHKLHRAPPGTPPAAAPKAKKRAAAAKKYSKAEEKVYADYVEPFDDRLAQRDADAELPPAAVGAVSGAGPRIHSGQAFLRYFAVEQAFVQGVVRCPKTGPRGPTVPVEYLPTATVSHSHGTVPAGQLEIVLANSSSQKQAALAVMDVAEICQACLVASAPPGDVPRELMYV